VGDRARSYRRHGATRRPSAACTSTSEIAPITPSVLTLGDQTTPLVSFEVEAGYFHGKVQHGARSGDRYLIRKHLEESRELFVEVVGVESDLSDELGKRLRHGHHRTGRVLFRWFKARRALGVHVLGLCDDAAPASGPQWHCWSLTSLVPTNRKPPAFTECQTSRRANVNEL
jgi:hypothetical protein